MTSTAQFAIYLEHFGLSAEPFAITPDPSCLYLSPSHSEALAALKIGVAGRQGLVVLTGEVGSGKTTLLYELMSGLEAQRVHTAYVCNTTVSSDDFTLLRAVSGRRTLEQMRELDWEGDAEAFLPVLSGYGLPEEPIEK